MATTEEGREADVWFVGVLSISFRNVLAATGSVLKVSALCSMLAAAFKSCPHLVSGSFAPAGAP